MKSSTLLTVFSLVAAHSAMAVDFTGPGSDLAARANWGDTLPSETDAVNFPVAAYPEGGFKLSADVTFGATTVPAGYGSAAIFNLGGHAYWAKDAEFAVKSDATISNGAWTNKTIAIDAGKTLTVSGANTRLKATAATGPFGAGTATLHVTDGATFYPGGNAFNLGSTKAANKGGRMLFDKGSTFDCREMTGEYNLAIINNKAVGDGFETIFDASTFYFYSINIGAKWSGDVYGAPRNFLFAFRNGSTVQGVKNPGARLDCCGWRFGIGGAGSVSNRLEVTDSTVSIPGSNGIRFGGNYDTFYASNATVTIESGIGITGGHDKIFTFRDSSIAADITMNAESVSNTIEATGCTAFPSALTMNGFGNALYLSNAVATAVTLSGTNNTAVIASANALKHTIEGAGCSLTYTASEVCNAALPFSGNAADKVFVLAGGQYESSKIEFAGTNNTLLIRDGGRMQYGTASGTLKDAFNFKPNASSNYTVRIGDGGTVGLRGQVNFSGNCSSGDPSGCYRYNWTNCPNCSVEFSGKHPRMVCADYKSNYPLFGLGTPDEEPLADPVVFRFVIPEGGFQEAPLRNETSGFRMFIYGNQPFAFRLADGYEPQEKISVPFLYDADGFAYTKDAKGGLPMTAERVAKLNENAIFELDPNKYRGRIVYDSAAKSLVAEIRPVRGLLLIVR